MVCGLKTKKGCGQFTLSVNTSIKYNIMIVVSVYYRVSNRIIDYRFEEKKVGVQTRMCYNV